MLPDAENDNKSESEVKRDPTIDLEGASFAWTDASDSFSLKNVTMKVDETFKLTMIAGLVGSGKSTLAQAILGQDTKTGGSLTVHGSRLRFSNGTPYSINYTMDL